MQNELLAFIAESKLLLVGHPFGQIQRTRYTFSNCIPVTKRYTNLLYICYICYSGCSWNHYWSCLQESSVILHDPSIFDDQIRELSESLLRTTTMHFSNALVMILISSILLKMQYWLGSTIFPSKGNSNSLLLIFPSITTFSQYVREPVGILPLLNIAPLILCSGAGEIITRWVQRPTGHDSVFG